MFERRIWSRTPGHGAAWSALVLLDRLGLDPDPLAEPPDRHGQRAAPAAADDAAAAATSSAIARHSSPSGNR